MMLGRDMQGILDQWRRLILPPEDRPIEASEQRDDGSGWDDMPAGHLMLKKHLAGIATYAVAPGWHDPATGRTLTRVGVLAVEEEGGDAPVKARALHDAALAAGLSAALAWSGGGGCQVWIFAEPVADTAMTAVLRRLREAVPHQGAVVPGERARVTLAPGWGRAGGGWAYFYKPDELPSVVDSEVVPGGLMDYQVEVLAPITPTPAAVLTAFAGNAGEGEAAVSSPPQVSAAMAEPAAGRVALTLSPDGGLVRLTVRGADGGAMAAELEAEEALALASDLIEAARRRLARRG